MQKNTTRYIVSLGLLGLALAWPSVSHAYYLGPCNTTLPPLDGAYVSPDAWHAAYALGIYITDARHSTFTASYPPPTGGGTDAHTFGSRVDGRVSFDFGTTWTDFWATGPTTVRIHDAGGGIYSTEMVALDLSGGSLPLGVLIRESPTRASTGITTYTPQQVGCRIDSYFDIYTELSLDGGQTWYPDQDGSVHMNLVPEPSSFMLTGLGLLGLLTYVRRCRK